MRHPHPWLARLARAGIVLSVVVGLAAVGATVLIEGQWGWGYASYQLKAMQSATTPGNFWRVGKDQTETIIRVVAGPSGWLLATWLLRQAATGRLRLGVTILPLVRWSAVAGMLVGVLAFPLGVMRWEDPEPLMPTGQYRAAERLRLELSEGQVFWFSTESTPAYAARCVNSAVVRQGDAAQHVVLAACREGSALFDSVRTAGVFFFLCGVVYCLASRNADDSP